MMTSNPLKTISGHRTGWLVAILAGIAVSAGTAKGIVQSEQQTGAISGRVLDADTLNPLTGIRVGSSSAGWAVTDSEGYYVLRAVPIGKQRIAPHDERPEYIYESLNAPIVVLVTANRESSGIDFHVRFEATVTGTVSDEDGVPLSGARVVLVARGYSNSFDDKGEYSHGDLWYSQKAFAVTDDRGKYVLNRVAAGRPQWILAYQPKLSSDPIASLPEAGPRKRTLQLTYYPSATSLTNAAPLILASEERRDNVDIHMARVPAYCLGATLKSAGLPAKMRFALTQEEIDRIEHSDSTLPTVSGESGTDGTIRICDLQAGIYNLAVFEPSSSSGGGLYSGSALVNLADRDVERVEVVPVPPLTLSGEIISNTTSDRIPPGVRIGLTGNRFFLTNVSDTGRFSLGPIPRDYPSVSSHHSLIVTGLGPTQYVKDITQDGTSILYGSFVPGNGELRVIVDEGAGQITAHVVDPNAAIVSRSSVIVLPSGNTEAELIARMSADLTDDNGLYVASRLPPGKYFVLATDNPPPSVLRGGFNIEKSPETIRMLLNARSRGKEVDVEAGSQISISLAPIALK